jgi:hypothetical protein
MGKKGNKHAGRKSRIKNYKKTKHAKLAEASRKTRDGRKQQGE